MSAVQYRLSKEAVEDLNQIWLYTLKKWSIVQADRYYALIFEEMSFISQNHLTGKSIGHIKTNYRVTKVKSHLIFYRKIDADKVKIVRILHQRMNVKNRLT